MAKLFFTLYIMVLASFALFIFYISMIDLIGESIGSGAEIDEKVTLGTFKLLNESTDGLNPEETTKLIKKYKHIFGNEFQLLEQSTLKLNKKQISKLNKGRPVFKEEPALNFNVNNDSENESDDDLEIVYFKNKNTNKVWKAHLDYELDISISDSELSLIVSANQFSEGMMYLLRSKLLQEEQADWESTLAQLQPKFGLPLSIQDYDQIKNKLDVVMQQNLGNNKVINISQNTASATLVQQIPNNGKVLQVGPVEIPWYLRNFPYLVIASFVLAFATTLFLWLLPFWTSLLKIKKTANEFGSGNYSARIKHKGWSPISKISNAFNSMAEQTQQSIRKQKELTNAVSHELRTPVARMRFALEMLEASSNKADIKRYLKDLDTDIDELDLLLEELLTYARIDQESPHTKLTKEALIPWMNKSMDKLALLATANNKKLHHKINGIDANAVAQIEPRQMSRVLDNLVQNAIRYANSKVEVALSKDQHGYLLIVEDDGHGIHKDEREHIFDAFSRIDSSRDRASGGFGLGLAIADRIIKAHNGSISLRDSSLGGACFEVRFPSSHTTS